MNRTETSSPRGSRLAALALLAWTLWWGGLTFYALIVVPAGTNVVGTTVQGMITQQVTSRLNLLGAAAQGLLLAVGWRRRARGLAACSALALLCQGVLFVQHRRLTGMLDLDTQTVAATDNFYAAHQLYLWLTTIQWGLGLAAGLLLWLAPCCDAPHSQRAAEESPP